MRDACKKIGYKFTLAEVEDWLKKQAIYRVYKPPPKFININKNYIDNFDQSSNITITLGIYRNRSTLSDQLIFSSEDIAQISAQ
jgi:hypothetical protein